MANTYFQFKQFRIDQEHCAMKVSTEACILGAWYASKFRQSHTGADRLPEASEVSKAVTNPVQPDGNAILDIGSGTGLLMLMLAQMTDVEIHGIELNTECFGQLTENITKSPWSSRMKLFHGDARNFSYPATYDFIISNPPFYENELASDTPGKQLAMHSAALGLENLAEVIVKNLSGSGTAGILLPVYRSERFEMIASRSGMFKSEVLKIRQTPKHQWFREISSYTFNKGDRIAATELTIRNQNGDYSKDFVDLLKPYYLNFPD